MPDKDKKKAGVVRAAMAAIAKAKADGTNKKGEPSEKDVWTLIESKLSDDELEAIKFIQSHYGISRNEIYGGLRKYGDKVHDDNPMLYTAKVSEEMDPQTMGQFYAKYNAIRLHPDREKEWRLWMKQWGATDEMVEKTTGMLFRHEFGHLVDNSFLPTSTSPMNKAIETNPSTQQYIADMMAGKLAHEQRKVTRTGTVNPNFSRPIDKQLMMRDVQALDKDNMYEKMVAAGLFEKSKFEGMESTRLSDKGTDRMRVIADRRSNALMDSLDAYGGRRGLR